jgi:hypothetical protein
LPGQAKPHGFGLALAWLGPKPWPESKKINFVEQLQNIKILLIRVIQLPLIRMISYKNASMA